MQLVLVTPPTAEPLTAAEVKARLNIGSEVQDTAIDAFIKAARQTLDGWNGWLGRALVKQTWKMILDERFPCEQISIPLPPLIAVDSVKYIDQNGIQQTMDPSRYQRLDGEPGSIVPAYNLSWPSTRRQLGAVEVQFTCGFGEAGADVDEPIRQAITLMVSNLRSLSARNLFLSQDTVDGVGSKYYVVGGNAAAAIDAAVNALLSPYRVYA